MTNPLDVFVLGGGSAAVAVIAYFMRKVDAKVDANAENLAGLRDDFNELKADIKDQIASTREDIKEDMIEVFNGVCHERQNSCSRLQDVKIKALEAKDDLICSKLSQIKSEIKEDWIEQKHWNNKFEDKINGKFWQSGGK